jgi:hypothetical protein
MTVLPGNPVGSPVGATRPPGPDDQELTAQAELVIMLVSTSAPLPPIGTIFVKITHVSYGSCSSL